jgi:hypothetical protein
LCEGWLAKADPHLLASLLAKAFGVATYSAEAAAKAGSAKAGSQIYAFLLACSSFSLDCFWRCSLQRTRNGCLTTTRAMRAGTCVA